MTHSLTIDGASVEVADNASVLDAVLASGDRKSVV